MRCHRRLLPAPLTESRSEHQSRLDAVASACSCRSPFRCLASPGHHPPLTRPLSAPLWALWPFARAWPRRRTVSARDAAPGNWGPCSSRWRGMRASARRMAGRSAGWVPLRETSAIARQVTAGARTPARTAIEKNDGSHKKPFQGIHGAQLMGTATHAEHCEPTLACAPARSGRSVGSGGTCARPRSPGRRGAAARAISECRSR